MNEQQIENLIRFETALRHRQDSDHLAALAADLTADLPSWALRRRIVGSLLAVVLVVGVPLAYGALLASTGSEPLVACNLSGQEEAVVQCANTILT